MLFAATAGELELRAGRQGTQLRGRFPYNATAVLSDGGRTGRPRKERIASRAFGYRVDRPAEDIHLLVGHSYDAPLASKGTGSLVLRDADDALTFEATIAPAIAETTYGRNALAMIEAGLAVGISPGFRIPPKRAVPVAEKIEDEPYEPEKGTFRAVIRTILDALLYELSVVTVPAYSEAQVAMRNWNPDPHLISPHNPLKRWRL